MDKKQYLALIQPALDIVVKKHEDYGNDDIGLHSYFPLGLPSYAQMLHVKTQRLVSFARDEREPNFESVKDNLLDLINYAVFTLDYLEQEE
jgi:hypothetical protein